MATTSTYLKLTLPAFNEFANTWHLVMNANAQLIDDWANNLYKALVAGSPSVATWDSLRGSMASLAERLDVSINADGTLDTSGSDSIIAIGTSATRGDYSSPRDRLDDGDFEIYEAGAPAALDRFLATAYAGFPHGELQDMVALMGADVQGSGLATPLTPTANGLIKGPASLITAEASDQIRVTCGATAALFSIDGYVFRIREDIIVDYSAMGVTPGDRVWLYVARLESNYNSASFQYKGPGGALAQKDLRKLQTGTGTGTTSGNIFTATGATFNSAAMGKVKAGDILVITTGAAAGSYVIEALDGVTPDTKLTIKGTFKANLAALNWYVWDPWMPNIGVATETSGVPATVAGRVYVANFTSGNPPSNEVTLKKGGVYDSGWVAITGDGLAGGVAYQHSLGCQPTSVQVFCRTTAGQPEYPPVVQRSIVTNTVGPVSATLLVPSLFWYATDQQITLKGQNVSSSPAKPNCVFTDSAGNDQGVSAGAVQIRIVCRR